MSIMGLGKVRKYLSGDGLIGILQKGFAKIVDPQAENMVPKIPFSDILMSCFTLFSLKYPSLLSFDEDRKAGADNLKSLYRIGMIPSDTQMRERLDTLEPDNLRSLFTDVHRAAQRGKAFEPFEYYEGYSLLSLDGTGYFSSDTIHCSNCLEKKHSKSGKISYSHQMLGAALVHPDLKEVIPFAPEPIIKQDGTTKNDCERNAAKRFFDKLRNEYPYKKFIIIEDGLSSNAPHIHELQKHDLRFILGAKPGDHTFLFETFNAMTDTMSIGSGSKDRGEYQYRYVNNVPLNKSNNDMLVNVIEYTEIKKGKVRRFSWVTDIGITDENILILVRAGRARWKIENETFNTLKNQGYHFEHNFGHGKENLSSVMAFLMMLAFLVDQIQQISCNLFQAAWKNQKSKRSLWEKMRAYFITLKLTSMEELFRALTFGVKVRDFEILDGT